MRENYGQAKQLLESLYQDPGHDECILWPYNRVKLPDGSPSYGTVGIRKSPVGTPATLTE